VAHARRRAQRGHPPHGELRHVPDGGGERWYFSHPEARYFQVGQIAADQVAEYARRKGLSLAEAERWLAPIVGYEPGSRAV